jgi:hypothetical protein
MKKAAKSVTTVRDVTRLIDNWFENWRPCECGADEGRKFNTECGHAIDCNSYVRLELIREIKKLYAK